MSNSNLPTAIAVVGAGTMGNGIAQTFATCGVKTFMVDVKQEFLDRGLATVHKSLGKFVEKGTLTADVAERAKGLLTTTTDMGVMSQVDLCVEAVTENLEVKTKVFQAADAAMKPEAILASNTSSISITPQPPLPRPPPRPSALRKPMAAMRPCWPTRTSRPSTTRCPTTCMCR